MEQTYQYLLSLDFRHNYFRDGLFKPIQLSFDTESQQLLRSFGLIIKPYPGGVHLLCLEPTLLNTATESTALRLFLECYDPYYINYSDLPNYNPSDNILYFNNLNATPNSENSALNLHPEKNVGKNDVYKLSSGKLILDTFNEENTYHFEDVLGNDISNSIKIEQNGFLISYSYEGVIHVFENGVKSENVFVNPKTVWKKPMGIIELYLSKIDDHQQPENKLIYRLKFDVQKTKWKYFLVDSVYEKYKGLMIVDSSGKQHFTPSKEEKFQGKNLRIIESTKEISLAEFSNSIFQLKNKVYHDELETEAITVIGALPTATAEQIHFNDKNNKETKYSHIYI